jgi:hypothetical protein
MKVKTKFLQEGGAMPQEQAGAAAPGPEEQIMQMAQQIIQQLGPEASAMLAQVIMDMLQGGGAPQEAPVYARKGAKLVRIK